MDMYYPLLPYLHSTEKENMMHGPFAKIPEFTEGCGYGMMFSACDPVDETKNDQVFTRIGTAMVTGPDVHQVTIYQGPLGFYYD